MVLDMDFQTFNMIRAATKVANAAVFYHRRLYGWAQVFHLIVVLLLCCAILSACESWVQLSGCRSFSDNINPDIQDLISSEDLGLELGNLDCRGSGSRYHDNVFHDSNLFCFRSTLPGLSKGAKPESAKVSCAWSVAASCKRTNHMRANIRWSSDSSDCDIIKFTSGRTISCSLNPQEGCGIEVHDASCGEFISHKTQYVESNKGSVTEKSGISYDFSPNVEVSPSHLDWGQKFLFFPSVAFIEVTNTRKDDILTIYEPYSTNTQFYPCKSSEILLEPGEAVSICFVFLPAWLGLSSVHFLLQTSSVGFFIQATGFAIESPYKIQFLLDLNVSSSGNCRNDLSLFYPFNEALYVKKVVAWISLSAGNMSYSIRSVCSMNSIEDQHESLLNVKDWIDVKSSGVPLVSMRPHRNWEVGPHKTETIMELDISFPGKEKIFGAFCMQLQRSSTLETETVLVPFEAEHHENTVSIEHGSPVSLSLENLVPYGSSGNVFINFSMKNDASYVVEVVKISEAGESINLFHIKYVEGIILFPNTITQIASISLRMLDTLSELSGLNLNCELLVLTNESRNGEVEISCGDIVQICSRQKFYLSAVSGRGSETAGSDSIGTKPSSRAKQRLLLNEKCEGFLLEPGNSMKLIITYQADFSVVTIRRDLELVLGTSTFVILMKASLPLYMLNFCKKTVFWMQVKKFAVAILFTASVCFLLLGSFLPCMASFSQGYFFKTAKSSISTTTKAEKSAYQHQSQKEYSKLALSTRMNGLLRSIGEEQCNDGRAVTKHQSSTTTAAKEKDKDKVLTRLVPAIMNSVPVQSSDPRERSQAENLKVKTGKEKGSRKRKKKNSGNGITGLFEVSSSQSGNSAPSSPLSPASPLTPKTSRPVSPEVNYTAQARDPFALSIQRSKSPSSSQPKSKGNVLPAESVKLNGKKDHLWGISTREKLDVLPRMPEKPVLLPSATFPSAGKPNSPWSSRPSFVASTSTIAPYARAPGSKLYEQKAVKTEAKTDFEEKFRYDIWGEHIFGAPYMDRSKDRSLLQPHTTENTSYSFFVTGPQTLKSIAQLETVNCYNELG